MNRKQLYYLTRLFIAAGYYLLVAFPLVVSAAQVTLQWNANDPAPEGYRVYQRQSGQVYDYTSPTWFGSGTSCTLTGLIGGTTYHFIVRAYENSNESGNSNEVDHTPSAPPPPPADTDGDGVNDALDAFPLDPTEWLDTDGDGVGNNADTDDDADGMPDSWELQYGLDPLVDDANQDLDGDGVSNIDEYTTGGDPSQAPGNTAPDTPILSLPTDGATVGLTPTLETEAFADTDGDAHLRTNYQISTVADFSTLVFDRLSIQQLTAIDIPDLILDPEETYYWRIKFYDQRNGESQWSLTRSFNTIDYITAGDADGNGILDHQEVDMSVDLDGDGVSDAQQSGLLCVSTTDGVNPYVAVKRINSDVQVVMLQSMDANNLAPAGNQPDKVTGLISFKLYLNQGVTTTSVSVYFAQPAPAGAQWYKYDAGQGWSIYPNATLSADRKSLTLVLVDGGPGDQDGVQNGVIVDPAGLGYSSSGAQVSDSSASSSTPAEELGCFITCTTPSSHMDSNISSVMIMLVVLLVLSGFLVWMRRLSGVRRFNW